MKDLRYTQVYTDMLTGKVVKDGDKELTLQHLLYSVATAADPNEVLAIEKKMQLFTMAKKIVNMKPLRSADLHVLRARASRYLSITAFGFVSEEIFLALEETPEEPNDSTS